MIQKLSKKRLNFITPGHAYFEISIEKHLSILQDDDYENNSDSADDGENGTNERIKESTPKVYLTTMNFKNNGWQKMQITAFSNQKNKNKPNKSPFLFVIQARAILLFIINIIIAVYYYVKKLNYDGNKNKGEWQFGFISLLHYYFSLFRVFVVCCVQKC